MRSTGAVVCVRTLSASGILGALAGTAAQWRSHRAKSEKLGFEIALSMERVCKGYVPKNTTKATDWALRVFEQWKENRNHTSPEERVPEKLLEDGNAELLNLWLARFVVEIRRADGEPYPPSSINGILSGLYRYCKACAPTGSPPPNFMDRKNPHFRDLTGALQVKCRELREKGVGALVKHAAVITPDEEERFWETKVLGVHSPVALQRAVFFYVGKVFCLRGGEEQHHSLFVVVTLIATLMLKTVQRITRVFTRMLAIKLFQSMHPQRRGPGVWFFC